MPNLDNILSPILMIGNGGFGASMIARTLGDQSQLSLASGGSDLIHGVWKSLELFPEEIEFPDVIRNHLLRLFPSQAPSWLYGPLGIPEVHKVIECEEFIDWFWDVLEKVFPHAKYFTVLQNPLDSLTGISRAAEFEDSIQSHVFCDQTIAKIITDQRSKVDYAVNYHEFVKDPRLHLTKLCDHFGLEIGGSCLEKSSQVKLQNEVQPVNEGDRKSGHEQGWDQIPESLITTEYRDAVNACWEKFDFECDDWPRN